MSSPDPPAGFLLLRVCTQLVDSVQTGLAARGFDDVRPQHGFAFVRISAGDATTVDLASYLGVTKQGAAQLVDQLVDRGYVTREPHPHDGRAWLLVLTTRGMDCTRAAEQVLSAITGSWQQQIGVEDTAALERALRTLAFPGPIRPTW